MLTVTIHSITWGEQVWVHLLPSFMPFFNLNKVLEVGPKSRFSLEKKNTVTVFFLIILYLFHVSSFTITILLILHTSEIGFSGFIQAYVLSSVKLLTKKSRLCEFHQN